MTGKYYLTTPIYYVNDVPHIGHAYTTIAADAMARFNRLIGKDVFFLTGTDEHGLKVQRAAETQNIAPKELADRVVPRFRNLWRLLSVSNDDFIRTTEPRHAQAVQAMVGKMADAGDIYLGEYEDWYCTPDESFFTETQLVNNCCPDCGRPVERVKEKSYFFRLSRYQAPLLRHIRDNKDFIMPLSRRNEILAFVEGGLRDLSVSRTSFSWGIPMPSDPAHVIYVWIDALTNYISALGAYGADDGLMRRYWPADLHIIGKDILRFHAVYWPAMLMSAGLPLPRRIFAHGWWTVEGQKMSKSLGNVQDPYALAEKYGVDALRYFVLREIPFGLDGDYSPAAMTMRINSDLANDLGNLVSRTLTMVDKYCGGRIPHKAAESNLSAAAAEAWSQAAKAMEDVAFHTALASVWTFIGAVNKAIDSEKPWESAKLGQTAKLNNVMAQLAESLRAIAVMISPFMPAAADAIWGALGLSGRPAAQPDGGLGWGILAEGQPTRRIPALFPRLETA